MAQLKIWDETSSSWVPAVVGARGDTGADSTVVGPQGVQGETGPAVDTSTLSVEQAQVTGLVAGLAGKAGLTGGNTFTGGQIINNTGGGRIFQAFSGGVLKVYVDGQGLFRLGTSASGSTGNFHIENGSAGYGSPAAVAMSIRGAAGQTANLQEWQTSAGGVVASVDPNGNIRSSQLLNIATFSNSRLQMTNTGALFDTQIATNVPLAVRAAAGQTANLQEWQNSAGNIFSKIDSYGVGNFYSGLYATGGGGQGGSIVAIAGSTTLAAIIAKGAAGQTANLQEWQNSAGNVVAAVDAAGGIATTGVASRWTSSFLPANPTFVPIVIRGAAGQTANLQEWQNSDGGVKAFITSSGTIAATTGLYVSGSASNVLAVVKGAPSQSANLQEWQNSAGTAVAKVDATGTLTAANFLQGTGSPLGVVSANPGAIYVDTASTMGASQWQKMSGTGTTGWVVTVGDTGWRAVGVTQVWRDAVIGAGMTLSDDNANGIILRRINQRVEIYYGINKSVAGGAVASGLIPDGWRPGASTGYIGTNSSLERLRFYVPSYGSPGSFGSQVALSVSMPLSYLTANAWPTVLPGTAA
jgi:hypothetical protein